MVKGKKISLIIPCRNEEKGITKLVKSMPKWIDEVIVVDNNSSDKTAQVAKKAGAVVVKEKKVDHQGIGYGYAHMAGYKKATGDFIATIDGDDTYPAKDIKGIVKRMVERHIDFVNCNRHPLLDKDAISFTRRLGTWVLNTETWLLYGYPTRDILSGMFIFKKEVKNKLNVKQGGWNLSPEIKLNAISNPEIKYAECHINHFDREGVSHNQIWRTGFMHLFYILNKRFTEDAVRFNLFLNYFRDAIKFNGLSTAAV